MHIVDSHCHVSTSWYEPAEVLLFQMERNEVAQAILIQMFGQYDNSYQMECLTRYPGRFASVVLIDTDRPDAPQTLERLAAQGASGVRFRPTTRSSGDDPFLIWRTAEHLGLSVSCGGTGGNGALFATDDFAAVVAAVPQLKIVLEHLGSFGRTRDIDPGLRARIHALARYPNVFVKVPGMGELSTRAMPVCASYPFVEAEAPALDTVLGAFGPERLMWGSDYPPVSHREGYRNALRWPMEWLSGKNEAERALIFGTVAASVFPVR